MWKPVNDYKTFINRVCGDCGHEIVETEPYERLPGRTGYYCQGCGKDKREWETKIVEKKWYEFR